MQFLIEFTLDTLHELSFRWFGRWVFGADFSVNPDDHPKWKRVISFGGGLVLLTLGLALFFYALSWAYPIVGDLFPTSRD